MVEQVGYSVTGRSGGRVTPCVVCTVHVEMRSAGFLVEPQNQGRQFGSGLATKPLGLFSPGLASNQWLRFQGLGLKIGSCGLVIWVTKSSRRFLGLSLKTKQATVYQLRHETNGRVTAWDTHQDLVASFA
jgi:hypothetical protein